MSSLRTRQNARDCLAHRAKQLGHVLALLALPLTGCQGASHTLPQVTAEEIARANAEIDAAPMSLIVERSTNEAITLLNDVAMRLKKVAPPVCARAGAELCSFNIVYADSDVVNAFADGENDVIIAKALMRFMHSGDELAAIVGHEMGHHIGGHLGKGSFNRKSGRVLGGLLAGVLATLGGKDEWDTQDAMEDGADAGEKYGDLTYTKDHEREADYIGAYLMARAGFDLERGRMVWLRLAQQPGSTRETGLLDSHPASAERMAAWLSTMEEIKASPDLMPRWGN